MTIVETLIAAALIGVVLYVAAGGVRIVRERAKHDLARREMAALATALAAYHETTAAYPPDAVDGSAGPAIAAMLAVEPAAEPLLALPASLAIGRELPIGGRDPWGEPLRYVTYESPHQADRDDVRANRGIPIFESAGPDGDFGLQGSIGRVDNLRTSDL